jgi:hypothetical protein
LSDTSTSILGRLKAYPPQRYEGLDLNRLVALSMDEVAHLGLSVTFEHIVVTAFRLFPKKFCLVGFEEYPDAARINRALLQLGPKYRNWAIGGAKKGYTLTPLGQGAVEQARKEISQGTSTVQRRESGIPRSFAEQHAKSLRASDAYAAYKAGQGDDISEYDFCRLLHAMPSSPSQVLRENFETLMTCVRDTGSDDLSEFLIWGTTKFPRLSLANAGKGGRR